MQHSATGFRTFVEKLHAAMNKRIDDFEKHLEKELEKDPHVAAVKSKKQWTDEFKMWSEKIDSINNEILRYLSEGREK